MLLRILVFFCTVIAALSNKRQATFVMTWQTNENGEGYYAPTQGALKCDDNIIDIIRAKSLMGFIFDSSYPDQIKRACNCKTYCDGPILQAWSIWGGLIPKWNIIIEYRCTESTCPTTKFASPTVSFTTRLGDFTKSYTNIRSTLISRATKFESTTPPSKITTNTNIIPSTTSDEKVFTKRTAKDNENSTEIIVIALVAAVLGVAGGIVAVILVYLRWRRKKFDEATEGTHSKNTHKIDGGGIANSSYLKESEVVYLNVGSFQSDADNFYFDDSEYINMPMEEAGYNGNDDYNYISMEGTKKSIQSADNDYSAITESAGMEYNKIDFRTKTIPEDANYGSQAMNLMDRTYDHAQKTAYPISDNYAAPCLQDKNYSHLNQKKSSTNTNMAVFSRFKHLGKHTETLQSRDVGGDDVSGNDKMIPEYKENSSHNYFILEKKELQKDESLVLKNRESHKYFVLEEGNISTCDAKINTVQKNENIRDLSSKVWHNSNEKASFEIPADENTDASQFESPKERAPAQEGPTPDANGRD